VAYSGVGADDAARNRNGDRREAEEAKQRPPSLRFDQRDAGGVRRFSDGFRAALGWHGSRLLLRG